jgi:hypothetical protein
MTTLFLLLALGIPVPPSAAKVLASPDAAPLARPGVIMAARVDSYLESMERPPDVEQLRLPGVFRVRPTASALPAADAAAVRALLRRASSYDSGVGGCAFEPGMAFMFPARGDLMVLVCFKCEDVAFVRDQEVLATFSLKAAAARELLEVTARSFPELRAPTK